MRIAVLGTGAVGRALAGRLAELGHEVSIGTRDVAATLAQTAVDGMGNQPFTVWAQAHTQVPLLTFADAAAGAEVVVNATSGTVSLAALTAAGSDNLAGKPLLDISNPLDFSKGFPPSMSVPDTDSVAERIQAAFPTALVVKTLNTMTATLMVYPRQLADGDHSAFLSGNDAGAKALARELLESFGHTDIIDLGDITTARGAEMIMPLWLRAMGALGTSIFQFKIVR
ncbi:putative dinucleotide-binding enzyme [Allocatelliglobosispora scoriae]|uniref:Putative dinucleotide-binding enzyme n=1 Tax=Allocatelliglobosispora scoriae TaxID=643052 RepID=A0A841BMY4_9ACTN|nr:NAD(P)-binding domain-containing protein [Allocatelliglobosispora scoriae]MBB5868180.1 putative dinucleotide-binding enzyme [Allocatelliglobosispora scoriae]